MLKLFLEDFNSTRLRESLCRAVLAKERCILIVPEQETLRAEAQMAHMLPASAPLCFDGERSEQEPLCLDVTNFSRLANTVFRHKGGISYRYADKASASLLMWKALDSLSPMLRLTQKEPDATRVKEMLAALSELYAAGVSEDRLEEVGRALSGEGPLGDKLLDMAEVFRVYKGETVGIYGSQAEDLDRLARLIESEELFEGTHIFVDSFTSFTAQEYRILNALIHKAQVTVALTVCPAEKLSTAYEETRDTARRLAALAKEAGYSVEEGESASLPADVSHARHELFRADKKYEVYHGEERSLSLWCEENPFDAASRIASDIAARVMAGARYGDFVILTRSSELYQGVLDDIFSKQGIPFFMSEERDVFSFAAVKMIVTAYTVLNRSYRKEDIIAFLKCGFGGFTADEVDVFELYADFWRVGGRLFASGEDLTMNPSGYKSRLSKRDKETLACVNGVRQRLLKIFEPLKKATEGSVTVEAHLTALYTFLCETRCEERLSELAAAAEQRGNLAEAELLRRLFGTICGLLDRMHEVLGEERLTRERFAEVLTLLFSSVSVGQLPTSQDAVTVGNADMLRADGARFAYLLGVNEGEFPAAVTCGGAFNDSERQTLVQNDLPVEFDPMLRSSRESFCFLRALLCAKEAVAVIAYRKNVSGEDVPFSTVFSRLIQIFFPSKDEKKLTPSAALERFKTSNRCEPFSRRAAAEMLGEMEEGARKDALKRLLAEEGRFERYLKGDEIPISDTECAISPALAKELFGEQMDMTQTRLNDYVKCPFAYYCKSVLGLGENRDSDFGLNDIGTLIHAVLERLFKLILKDGKTIKSISMEELHAYVEQIAADYLVEICPRELADSPRQNHLFDRLRRAAHLIAEELYGEFQQSKFDPAFFEFKVGEGGLSTPIVFDTEDGGKIMFHGTVDRIDLYRDKDTGQLYFRVIDYKTGTKEFDLSDVEKGKNLQLLIYFFSLWKSSDEAFLESLGLKKGESLLPAGMLYMSTSVSDVTIPAPLAEEEVKEKVKSSLKPNGLVLEDESVVRAMDETLSGRYAPSPLCKGKIKWNKSFATKEKFEDVLKSMRTSVGTIGTKMRTGDAAAHPEDTKNEKESPCTYCPYAPVCRRS